MITNFFWSKFRDQDKTEKTFFGAFLGCFETKPRVLSNPSFNKRVSKPFPPISAFCLSFFYYTASCQQHK